MRHRVAYCPAPSCEASADCPLFDPLEMLVAAGVCPAAVRCIPPPPRRLEAGLPCKNSSLVCLSHSCAPFSKSILQGQNRSPFGILPSVPCEVQFPFGYSTSQVDVVCVAHRLYGFSTVWEAFLEVKMRNPLPLFVVPAGLCQGAVAGQTAQQHRFKKSSIPAGKSATPSASRRSNRRIALMLELSSAS